jgi:hypothetical protein
MTLVITLSDRQVDCIEELDTPEEVEQYVARIVRVARLASALGGISGRPHNGYDKGEPER